MNEDDLDIYYHIINNKWYVSVEDYKKLKNRIDKAIEYIKDNIIDFDFVNSEYPNRKNAIDIETNEEIIKDLVKILEGVNNND